MRLLKKPNRLHILILCQNQFGYHIDTYFYCKYLREKHNISYLCWDYRYPKQRLEGILCEYVSRNGNIFIRNLRYLRSAISCLRSKKYDICFIKYFRGCALLHLLFRKQVFVFDIRSGSISEHKAYRLMYDFCMKLESLLFQHVTIISSSLARRLRLQNKSHILPLGSITISTKIKTFRSLDLLYVGTLRNRRIDKTIKGLAQFLGTVRNPIKLSYTIIGSGYDDEVTTLRKIVHSEGLSGVVNIIGQVPFEKLKPYFDSHNIGVSFVPMTPYFDIQPVTKTFDYLLSGMPVIATATSENKLVINDSNGILIDDSPDGFCEGLRRMYKKLNRFDSTDIMKAAQKFHWKKIVADFEQYLLSVSRND